MNAFSFPELLENLDEICWTDTDSRRSNSFSLSVSDGSSSLSSSVHNLSSNTKDHSESQLFQEPLFVGNSVNVMNLEFPSKNTESEWFDISSTYQSKLGTERQNNFPFPNSYQSMRSDRDFMNAPRNNQNFTDFSAVGNHSLPQQMQNVSPLSFTPNSNYSISPSESPFLRPMSHSGLSQPPPPFFEEQRETSVTVFLVSFKTSVREFILGVRVPSLVSRGDMVIVSADRGEDLGLVSEVLPLDQYLRQYLPHMLHNPQFNVNKHFGRILRLATAREVRMLSMKMTAEQQAVELAEHLAYNVYGLPVSIVDAEFQFDRHKITIYYEAVHRADFRGFVKDMYDRYKARVWLQRV